VSHRTRIPELDREILAAVVARILPSHGTAGSAVMESVVQALESPFFRKLSQPLSTGLRVLDEAARQHAGDRFPACSPRVQDDLLERWQGGDLDRLDFPTHQLFEILISLSLEGWLHREARSCRQREAA
jgi:hypothetical protein